MFLPDLEIADLLANLAQLVVAFVLALPLGYDREQAERTAGIRTFPLVAMASCAFLLLGQSVADSEPNANARVLAGILSGIGFLGGGAILKQGGTVRGTATAASLWATAALGAAVAYRRYEVALVMSLATFVTLRWTGKLKRIARDTASDDAPSSDEAE